MFIFWVKSTDIFLLKKACYPNRYLLLRLFLVIFTRNNVIVTTFDVAKRQRCVLSGAANVGTYSAITTLIVAVSMNVHCKFHTLKNYGVLL